MKKFRHVAVLAVMLLVSAFADICAQTPEKLVEMVRSHAEDSSVKVSYKMEMRADGSLTKDSGMLLAQDEMWHLKGGFIEIYTDGKATWVMDPDSKEVVVEPAWDYTDLITFYNSLIKTGAVLDIQIVSLQTADKRPKAEFAPSFGSDWVVTDLR